MVRKEEQEGRGREGENLITYPVHYMLHLRFLCPAYANSI